MRSHSYEFLTRQGFKILAAPLIGLALLAAGLHAARGIGLLPGAKPIDNPDETVVALKSQLSRSHHPAQVILLGDSSCATGIDALQLRSLLPGHPGVLNLGLYVGFGLDIYGEILADYMASNPDQVRLVVLLVTPRFLMDESVAPNAYDFWRRGRLREDNNFARQSGGWSELLGLSLFKDRVVGQILHTPIPRGRFYGFSSDLAEYLASHDGSMIEPGLFRPPRHPILGRYFLAPTLEKASRDFRRRLPPGVKLAIGLTPVPESLCSKEYLSGRDELLIAWNEWMVADFVLTKVPVKIADTFFASSDHPNPEGQRRITRQLGSSLAKEWRNTVP